MELNDEAVTGLAGFLATNTALTTFELGDNNIGDPGATALAGALATNMALTILD